MLVGKILFQVHVSNVSGNSGNYAYIPLSGKQAVLALHSQIYESATLTIYGLYEDGSYSSALASVTPGNDKTYTLDLTTYKGIYVTVTGTGNLYAYIKLNSIS
jgi:hypothetical protein